MIRYSNNDKHTTNYAQQCVNCVCALGDSVYKYLIVLGTPPGKVNSTNNKRTKAVGRRMLLMRVAVWGPQKGGGGGGWSTIHVDVTHQVGWSP